MGGNAVKSIVLLLVLVVFSAIIGSQFSGSYTESYGAFGIISAIVALFALLVLGEKCWMLVYILPVLVIGMPHHLNFPVGYALSSSVFVLCILMWFIRHVKFYWNSVILMDLAVLQLSALMLASFIRYPVSINAFGMEFDAVGGKEYGWLLAALLHYIAVSTLTPRHADVAKMMKWCMLLSLLLQVPYCLRSFSERSVLVEDGAEARYAFLVYPGSILLYYAYASLPLRKLFLSLKTLAMLFAGIVMVFCCGGREAFLRVTMAAALLPCLKKELTAFVLLLLAAYGALLVLSAEHQTEKLPYGVQRVMTVIPGVNVTDEIRQKTEGSSNTRLMIWRLGLDPRTGLIKDYVWGDGFQISKASISRIVTATMRGTAGANKSGALQAYDLAYTGSWHNGWMTVLKRLGVVGLISVNLLFVCGLFFLVRVSSAYYGSKEYPYIMVMCLPFASIALTFVFGTQTCAHVFETFLPLSFMKALYCSAREAGKIKPLFVQERYVPLAIREQELSAAHR